jgi:hypothetical protein
MQDMGVARGSIGFWQRRLLGLAGVLFACGVGVAEANEPQGLGDRRLDAQPPAEVEALPRLVPPPGISIVPGPPMLAPLGRPGPADETPLGCPVRGLEPLDLLV